MVQIIFLFTKIIGSCIFKPFHNKLINVILAENMSNLLKKYVAGEFLKYRRNK